MTTTDYRGRQVLVLGTGLTGLALARWLVRRGARVRAADTRAAPPNAARLAAELPDVPLATGPLDASTFAGVELIAISPGVPREQPAIAEAVAAGAEIAGDVELFARELPAGQKLLAITGTNGKTTTTALTGELVRAAGLTAVVAGNFGGPVLDALASIESGAPWPAAFFLELSSFQLETLTSLAPTAATVLNVTANHMDRYSGIADYAAAKARIFHGPRAALLNRDAPIVRLIRRPGHTVQTFGASVPMSEEEWGLVSRPDGEWLARGGELLLPASALALVGRHNALNALAALALVASIARIRQPVLDALRRFRGLPHRMERVGEANGVVWVNDSKATTVAATEVALASVGRPVVLIAGGDGKGQSFAPLKGVVDRHCRAVLLIGRDAADVSRGIAGTTARVEHCGTLDAAVARAREIARDGDVVLLSPACASLDQFADYEARGERYAARVRSFAREEPHA